MITAWLAIAVAAVARTTMGVLSGSADQSRREQAVDLMLSGAGYVLAVAGVDDRVRKAA